LLCIVGNMHSAYWAIRTAGLIGLLLASATQASGQPPGHIRTAERRLSEILDEGASRSDTLRRLVEQLDTSDLVVYVQCAAMQSELSPGFGGRLLFVSTAAGVRYVLVYLNCRLPDYEQMALLGHELHHAVEVANAARIVDTASFGNYFARHGFTVADGVCRVTYETNAAQRAQARVRREVLDAAAVAARTRDDNHRSRVPPS
jgi:hypothetical protein